MCRWQPYCYLCPMCGKETRTEQRKVLCGSQSYQVHDSAYMNSQPKLSVIYMTDQAQCASCDSADNRQRDSASYRRRPAAGFTQQYQAGFYGNSARVAPRQTVFLDEGMDMPRLPADWHSPRRGPLRSFIDERQPWRQEHPGRHPEQYADLSEDTEDYEDDDHGRGGHRQRRHRRRNRKDWRHSVYYILD